MNVCFIGHRNVDDGEKVLLLLKQTVEKLIKMGASTFYFGSMSDFNSLSSQAVSELKRKYSHIKKVYVRSAFQYIDDFYLEYLKESYDDTYFPSKIENAGKCSYVERNYEMIDCCEYCVFYYNKNYVPPLKRQSKKSYAPISTRRSGTKVAYEYALKRKKTIINLFEN